MSAIYITLQLRRPRLDGSFAGSIAEGWYTVDGDVVTMCDRDGVALAGEKNRCKLKPNQTAREAAVAILKTKASQFGGRGDFNRRLKYQAMRY